jgi:hypothetical protein
LSEEEEERMDDSELFDVFNIDNNPEPVQNTVPGIQREDSRKLKKWKTEKFKSDDSSSNEVNGKRSYVEVSTKMEEDGVDGSENTPVPKKSRKNDNAPIVVDSFETETDQIVPATQGLQGAAVTDHNIVIKKRVSLYITAVPNVVVSSCCCLPHGRLEIYAP